jgi:hypothetical protein
MKRRGATMKKLVLVAGVLIAATTVASAQGYVYYGNPYGYGLGVYDYSAGSYPGGYAYVRGPYAAPPGFYWDGACERTDRRADRCPRARNEEVQRAGARQ